MRDSDLEAPRHLGGENPETNALRNALDEARDRAVLGDTAATPLTVTAAALAEARRSITSYKHRVAVLSAPRRPVDPAKAALEGIGACAEGLVHGRAPARRAGRGGRAVPGVWYTVARRRPQGLPDGVPLLAETCALLEQSRRVLDERGDAAVPEVQAMVARLGELRGATAEAFPLAAGEVMDLFAEVRRRILEAYAAEVEAQMALAGAVETSPRRGLKFLGSV